MSCLRNLIIAYKLLNMVNKKLSYNKFFMLSVHLLKGQFFFDPVQYVLVF